MTIGAEDNALVGTARAVRGIEAAAFVLRHALETYAVGGGEGARRLASAMESIAGSGGPKRLTETGVNAARSALGAAAAGKPTALIVSGDGVLEALPVVREMVRVGAPVLIVMPSHGPDEGGSLPAGGLHDVAILRTLPLGVLIAADATQAANFALAALRAGIERGAPWVVAFDLAQVGLGLANTVLPAVDRLKGYIAEARATGERGSLPPPEIDLERYQRDIDRYTFAIGAAMRDLERAVRHTLAPVLADGARDADLVIIATGAPARAALHALPHLGPEPGRSSAVLQVASWRPFPAAELVRLSWRARAVIVHEPLPEPLGTGGSLSDAVRASFADALSWHPAFGGIGRIPPVVTVVGHDVSPEQWVEIARTVNAAGDPPRLIAVTGTAPRGGASEARVEIAMDEATREAALRLVVDWLTRIGVTVVAHAHEPTRAAIAIRRDVSARGPAHVLLACEGSSLEPSRLEALPAGAVAVLAGDFPDRVLAETMRAGAQRGVRVATLHPRAGKLRSDMAVVSVVASLLPAEPKVQNALEAAVRDAGTAGGDGFVEQVRAFADSLRAQFA